MFVVGVIQPGDIVLTTTPELLSQRTRKVAGSYISHAMICVGKSSVINSTGEGVHARNLERLILEPNYTVCDQLLIWGCPFSVMLGLS